MRVLAVAVVLLVVTVPPRARAAELLNDKILPVPDEIGGGGDNGGGFGPESGGGDPSSNGAGVCPDGDDDTEAAVFDRQGICQMACSMVGALPCTAVAYACFGAEALTLGGITIPCGIVVVGACMGGVACLAAC